MSRHEVTTLAGGCFWCLEAAFQQLKGVEHVQSGYAGGHVPNPSYEDVCTGTTGHQYRSAIFYHSPEQEATAERVMAELRAGKVWDDPIVTELKPLAAFYPAEEYHRDYFRRNPNQGYCSAVIAPKVAKVRKLYLDKLKQPTA